MRSDNASKRRVETTRRNDGVHIRRGGPFVSSETGSRAARIFPKADHGILRFEEAKDGTRRYLGYEPEYLRMQIEWVRRQSG